MDSINMTFRVYCEYLARAMAVVIANRALQPWARSLSLDGIISGASQSFFVFNSGGTVVEGDNLNALPGNNIVYLVSPNQLNVAPDAYNARSDSI